MRKHKKFYLESLLPEEPYLSSLKQVKLVISPEACGKKVHPLNFENPINTHLFKPTYYFDSDNTTICYCATLTVAQHVRKAWEIYAQNFKPLKIRVKIQKEKNHKPPATQSLYSKYIQKLLKKAKIQENIIIGKIDSLNAFLKMLFLKNEIEISQDKFKRLFIELEMHRLRHHLLTLHNFQIFENYLDKKNLKKLESLFSPKIIWVGKYLGIENIKYKGKKITILNLPWGQDLAYAITKQLVARGKNIKKIFVVGGVGCVSDGVEIDDIFAASSTQDENGNVITFENEFRKTFDKDGERYHSPSRMFAKKIVWGKLLCVNSSLGHEENFSQKSKAKGISAFDMESYGIVKAIKENKSKAKIFMIHYIMDLPLKGLGLGATYYNKEFLTKLFSNFNRGKYFCFDHIFEHI